MLVGHDADNVAFAWVKFHLPGVLPFLQRVKVFLKQGLVLLVFNSSVQKAVVRKKSLALECLTILGRSLIYVNKRRGPRTVPWGTPDRTAAEDDSVLSRAKCCFLSVRKDCIRVLFLTP